jgi:hypothetical protein
MDNSMNKDNISDELLERWKKSKYYNNMQMFDAWYQNEKKKELEKRLRDVYR